MVQARESLRLSLVVPAYNEADALPRLLQSIDAARGRFTHGPGAVEVIVADNASTDSTSEIALRHGCLVARVEKRAIAAARNGGARLASGEMIAFVDADSRIHPETFNAIDRALASPRVVGGATGVRMERLSVGIGVTYALMVPLVWLTGFDTGVVFCRRADFLGVGGYDESMLFAEDVRFLAALRRLGRTRGQRLTRLRPVKAIASTRKFDERGEWHYLWLLARGGVSLVIGRPANALARRYWYDVRRSPRDPPA